MEKEIMKKAIKKHGIYGRIESVNRTGMSMDAIKELHDKYKKPLMLRKIAALSKGGGYFIIAGERKIYNCQKLPTNWSAVVLENGKTLTREEVTHYKGIK